jgi:acyl-coenzyme A synthetase/AMP-(fatty) acid ligase
MPQRALPREPQSLWQAVSAADRRSERWLADPNSRVSLAALAQGSSLGNRGPELRGRSVLLSTRDQLPAALALIQLDGIARRIVLCASDVAPAHLPAIMATAEIDAVVGDDDGPAFALGGVDLFVPCGTSIAPGAADRPPDVETEWVLLTSGTTGVPKLVAHSFATLTAPMLGSGKIGGADAVWSTFYDMRRYAGLQTFLRAMLGAGSMVLSSARESVGDFLVRVGASGVTHINGTPSHWRRALMSAAAVKMAPSYVRLSGEIADQAVLDHLRAAFPKAGITHCFASTEAGIIFDVTDVLAGFPPEFIARRGKVEVRLVDGSLRIKSNSNALGYLGDVSPMCEADGFVDTGDMVELRDGRYFFVGRRGGVINIGGQKVHPEEIEAVINRHPGVRMSLVTARKSPITGAIVVADVIAASEPADVEALKREILDECRAALARYKVPASIRLVPAIEVAPSGKLARRDA